MGRRRDDVPCDAPEWVEDVAFRLGFHGAGDHAVELFRRLLGSAEIDVLPRPRVAVVAPDRWCGVFLGPVRRGMRSVGFTHMGDEPGINVMRAVVTSLRTTQLVHGARPLDPLFDADAVRRLITWVYPRVLAGPSPSDPYQDPHSDGEPS